MEGPSLHLLQQELSPFVNTKIKDIFGNASFDKEPLLNQKIRDIFAFGKRLFIQLDDAALVIHFLMYGSYRIDTSRPEMKPRLAIITAQHSLFLYNCSVKCVQESSIKKYLPLELDILSPAWNVATIVKSMQHHPNETIDDILLDQNIFPGVGNIIKNEVLLLSKTSPYTRIAELTPKQLKSIALHAREFSQHFLQWRKAFELKKNLQIYRKKSCPLCGGPIIRAKTGKRQRWTFYCPNCQR